MSTTRFDPDELATLESERDFLLRSIDDLEAERAAGNLEDDRYRSLRDDYTTRAAAVLRSIEEGADARPAPPALSWRRRLLTAIGIVAFAGVAAVLLAGALGQRLPGGSATGNAQSDRRQALEAQVRQHPDSAPAHLAYARYLLDAGEVAGAVAEFDTAARLDPGNPEPAAYGGWLVFLAARSESGDPQAAKPPSGDVKDTGDVASELTAAALRRLDQAVAADPDYPDAHFFRGMVLLRGVNDPAGAATEFERYLALVPEGPQSEQVRQLLDAARSQAGKP
ncbi:MAG: tetratricopeptide repeat protein [Acidimicrobiia bacterium]